MKRIAQFLRQQVPGILFGFVCGAATFAFLWASTFWTERYSLAVQAYATVILAGVTFLLALAAYFNIRATKEQAEATKRLAEEAQKQAQASVKMAEQMTKPRLIPYLRFVGDFDPSREVPFEAGVDNDGDGPAYDLEFRIEDEGMPPSSWGMGAKVSVLRGHQCVPWHVPDPRLSFPKSDSVQRQFFIIKYKDVQGEYEIRQPFVMTTAENGRPVALLESVSKKTLQQRSFEEDLP